MLSRDSDEECDDDIEAACSDGASTEKNGVQGDDKKSGGQNGDTKAGGQSGDKRGGPAQTGGSVAAGAEGSNNQTVGGSLPLMEKDAQKLGGSVT